MTLWMEYRILKKLATITKERDKAMYKTEGALGEALSCAKAEEETQLSFKR